MTTDDPVDCLITLSDKNKVRDNLEKFLKQLEAKILNLNQSNKNADCGFKTTVSKNMRLRKQNILLQLMKSAYHIFRIVVRIFWFPSQQEQFSPS
jgi:hypothetical protein